MVAPSGLWPILLEVTPLANVVRQSLLKGPASGGTLAVTPVPWLKVLNS